MARKRSDAAADRDTAHCAWEWEQGRRCRLVAETRPLDEAGYCGWHDQCLTLSAGRFADDESAFREWWDVHYGSQARPAYCTLWTHYPVEYLWALTLGQQPSYRLPECCRIASCPFAPVGEGPRDARAALKQIADRLRTAPVMVQL